MHEFITGQSLEVRLRQAISIAWAVFSRKVGGGLVPVNKEASMQLQYAYVLKQVLPLILHDAGEKADLELETGVRTSSGTNNVDILVRGESASGKVSIAIEMKCYRRTAASGNGRGATDIFMKDVYEDLHVLEEYVREGIATRGVALVMNDHLYFVKPGRKDGKCWAYDISDGMRFHGGRIQVQVGAKNKKPIDVHLRRTYAFDWMKFGDFWFLELEGSTCPLPA